MKSLICRQYIDLQCLQTGYGPYGMHHLQHGTAIGHATSIV